MCELEQTGIIEPMSPGLRQLLRFFAVLIVVICLGFAPRTAPAVSAQGSQPTTYRSTSTVELFPDEIARYEAAIGKGSEESCAEPSLECLVHNVTRFVAIEWLIELKGGEEANPTSSIQQQSPFAGAVPGFMYLIKTMYEHPPAQTSIYVADVLDSAGIAQPAQAQGLGFAALQPVLELWKTFRNIAYMFFVVIFIVIGFMIMFRQKIGGQTAVTVQQAIPSIVVSLVFVTFSYAIAGFMIDLMYVMMYLIVGIFESAIQITDAGQVIDYNIFNLGWLLMSRVGNLSDNIDLIGSAFDSFSNSAFLNNIGAIGGGITISLILVIAMLIGVIKLFFELLRSYATVMISTVMAPLILMMGAIPGRNVVGTWLKTIAGNLLPFPTVLVVVAMFLIFRNSPTDIGGFAPPFLLGAGRGAGNVVSHMMGLAIVLALPEIVAKIRDSVAPKNAFVDMITSGATKRFKEGEIAIPYATGLSSGATRFAQSTVAAKRENKVGWREAARMGKRGWVSGVGTKSQRVYKGFDQGVSGGYETGKKARVIIDRALEGRLGSAEDQQALLAKIAGQNQPQKIKVWDPTTNDYVEVNK